jgi:hypothetical protein
MHACDLPACSQSQAVGYLGTAFSCQPLAVPPPDCDSDLGVYGALVLSQVCQDLQLATRAHSLSTGIRDNRCNNSQGSNLAPQCPITTTAALGVL